jgi:hypothetical protein
VIIEVEEQFDEYFIVSVDREEYDWRSIWREPDVTNSVWGSIDKWCTETWGETGIWGNAPSTWKRMGPRYFFQHEQDRELFVLRWS